MTKLASVAVALLIRNLWLFLPFLFSATHAAEIGYKQINPFDGQRTTASFLYITGELKAGDSERLRELVINDALKFIQAPVVLDSTGGNVVEALRIADLVKAGYLSVSVPTKAKCLSACFYILASAVTRYMEGTVGIHRPYLPKELAQKLNIVEMEKKQKEVYAKAKEILISQNVPQYLIEQMFSNASDEIYLLSQKDKDAIGFRANWYEQMLVSKCGLDKKLENRYLLTNDGALLNKIRKVQHCELEIKAGVAYENTIKTAVMGWL